MKKPTEILRTLILFGMFANAAFAFAFMGQGMGHKGALHAIISLLLCLVYIFTD